jgi:hypothetical protein
MPPETIPVGGRRELARRIVPHRVRELFLKLWQEIALLGDDIEVEVAPFEARFTTSGGYRTVVSPYRETFLVSIGSQFSCDVRVGTEEAYISALDLALQHYLEVQSAGQAGTS